MAVTMAFSKIYLACKCSKSCDPPDGHVLILEMIDNRTLKQTFSFKIFGKQLSLRSQGTPIANHCQSKVYITKHFAK